MKNKIKNYMNSPVTWGGYWKLSVICIIISLIIGCGDLLYIFWDDIPWPWRKKKVKSVEDDEE